MFGTYRLWVEVDIEADYASQAVELFLGGLPADTCVNPVIDVAEWLELDAPPEHDQATSIDVNEQTSPVIHAGEYTNYLNRDDCIDHGLHMTEFDDDDRCDHCGTLDTQ